MNYTSIEQSKKLLKLGLNLESADMSWHHKRVHYEISDTWNPQLSAYKDITHPAENRLRETLNQEVLPCWSVGALLELIPKEIEYESNNYKDRYYFTIWHDRIYYIGHNRRHIPGCFDFTHISYGEKRTLIEALIIMIEALIKNGYIKK